MDEYISRKNILSDIEENIKKGKSEQENLAVMMLEMFDKYIKEFPAADVQRVKHGRWSECYTDSRLYSGICSVCGGAAIRSVKANPLDYCPNCGARMEGDKE